MCISARHDYYSLIRAILVLQGQLSSFALQSIQIFEKTINEENKNIHKASFRIERFDEMELQVNITEHVLVPEHTVLTAQEKKNLLQLYRITDDQLPKIQINDPIARYDYVYITCLAMLTIIS